MLYRFALSYQSTDSDTVITRSCHPIYGDDLSVSMSMESGEWYLTRKLEGKLTFVREDYSFIMQQAFDGTFTLTIYNSSDGSNWQEYFSGTFSRASLNIDEDNRTASPSSFTEGVYNAIENGKEEEYDLLKLIPPEEAKEVDGIIPPALAMVDYISDENIDSSDMFCGSPLTSAGYNSKNPHSGFNRFSLVTTDDNWLFVCAIGECLVKMNDPSSAANGYYAGTLNYTNTPLDRTPATHWSVAGTMRANNTENLGYKVVLDFVEQEQTEGLSTILYRLTLYNASNVQIGQTAYHEWDSLSHVIITPVTISAGQGSGGIESITVFFHYIRATLLTQAGGNADNVLDTGNFYKRMQTFINDGYLQIRTSSRTVEQPNGHRLIEGTGEQGTTPQYFAPPNDLQDWIPLAESNWHYASMWYTIVPTVDNGLLDSENFGSFRWTLCWPIGTCIRYLLDRISDGKVVFSEDSTSSRFLYDNANPVAGQEPFDYLVTQKGNVMNASGSNGSRCVVRLQWFLELLRNAFNVHWWLEKRNDGKYLFRAEHVEFFRNGGRYDGDLEHIIDITKLKPRRNFQDNNNLPGKTYADQTNKYSYSISNMVEKYTFGWQGNGGSDAFKGNPMFFKAGWIEKASSESHQVDNIFTDLPWLLLNAGSDTESSKNRDGLFLFAGYRPTATLKLENATLTSQNLILAPYSNNIFVSVDIWLTAPNEMPINLKRYQLIPYQSWTESTFFGIGRKQLITVEYESAFINPNRLVLEFGTEYADVTIHRIHAHTGNIYYVPNTEDLLGEGFLQNGPLAWPWLQNEYLHYDIPAQKWSYLYDDIREVEENNSWNLNGTVKMIQKQDIALLPIPEKSTEDSIMSVTGIRTAIEGGKTGIISNAKINLGSRNAEISIIFNPIHE